MKITKPPQPFADDPQWVFTDPWQAWRHLMLAFEEERKAQSDGGHGRWTVSDLVQYGQDLLVAFREMLDEQSAPRETYRAVDDLEGVLSAFRRELTPTRH